jgi:hypothetical protein
MPAVKRARTVSDPPAGWPVRSVAGDLLDGLRRGGRPLRAALDRADAVCRLVPGAGGADGERRELLAGIVEELRGTPAPGDTTLWAGLLAHLATLPAPLVHLA